MIKFFKKKTREEQIEKRVNDVMQILTSTIECEFSELETVLILNEVRRKQSESLLNKKAECYSKSVEYQQKAKEIQNAHDLIE